MSSLIEEVKHRLNNDGEEPDLKVFTVRLPIEMIEQMEDIGSLIGMKRTEVARMILRHGVKDVVESLQLRTERHGLPFEEVYAIELGEKTFDEVLEEYKQKEKGE